MIKMNWMSLKIHLGCEVREFQVRQKIVALTLLQLLIRKDLLAITCERRMYQIYFVRIVLKNNFYFLVSWK